MFNTVVNVSGRLMNSSLGRHVRYMRVLIATLRSTSSSSATVQPKFTSGAVVIKKRPLRKTKTLTETAPNSYNVVAYATAEAYDLDGLARSFRNHIPDYQYAPIANAADVLHAISVAKDESTEPRHLFFFKQGSVVLWNCLDAECCDVLNFVKPYEIDRYGSPLVLDESEVMTYRHQTNGKNSKLERSGDLLLRPGATDMLLLDKYTFSNAMVQSVKLAIWEANLERFVGSIEFLTDDLRSGRRCRMSRDGVLRKHGELLALRHTINLGSDLLDTPDFYWDHEPLERLFLDVCQHFNISKRTRVINERINHCMELMELLSTHLSDKHHTRLEWMIIVLIMVEVVFESLHYIERM